MLHDNWRCHLGGEGDVVIITETLSAMEMFLDWYEAQLNKELQDVAAEQEAK
jgi:hypothetical protein